MFLLKRAVDVIWSDLINRACQIQNSIYKQGMSDLEQYL